MSMNNLQLSELAAASAYGSINNAIRSLDFAELEPRAAIGDTFLSRLQRLVKVYAAVKPLIEVISGLPLLPQAWRVGVALFLAALDAVTSSPEVNPDFKAGKDL